ncbi:MAG: hypothetical protein AB4050_18620, partial [Synechococcus sp.]
MQAVEWGEMRWGDMSCCDKEATAQEVADWPRVMIEADQKTAQVRWGEATEALTESGWVGIEFGSSVQCLIELAVLPGMTGSAA